MSRIALHRNEDVTNGTEHIGRINVTSRGVDAFDPIGQYVATFETLPAARRALYDRHRDSAAELAKA